MTLEEARELRTRFGSFAREWGDPEMDLYDSESWTERGPLRRIPEYRLSNLECSPPVAGPGSAGSRSLPRVLGAKIPSSIESAGPTPVLIQMASPEGRGMGLRVDSVIALDNLATAPDSRLMRQLETYPVMEAVEIEPRRLLRFPRIANRLALPLRATDVRH